MDLIRRDRFVKRPPRFSHFLSYYYNIVNNQPVPFDVYVEELVDGHLIFIDGIRENFFQAARRFRDRTRARRTESTPVNFSKDAAAVVLEMKYIQFFPPLTLRLLFEYGKWHTAHGGIQRLLKLDEVRQVIVACYETIAEFEKSFQQSLLSLGAIFSEPTREPPKS